MISSYVYLGVSFGPNKPAPRHPKNTSPPPLMSSQVRCSPVNTIWRKCLYSGFETCFGPSTQGAGTKTHLKSRCCAILTKRGAILEFEIDGPSMAGASIIVNTVAPPAVAAMTDWGASAKASRSSGTLRASTQMPRIR